MGFTIRLVCRSFVLFCRFIVSRLSAFAAVPNAARLGTLALLAGIFCAAAVGQTAHFTGGVTATVPGYSNPKGVGRG